MPLGEGVVGADAATGLSRHLMPEPGDEHPLVEPLAGVTERGVARLWLARGEPIERDREVVNANLGHQAYSLLIG